MSLSKPHPSLLCECSVIMLLACLLACLPACLLACLLACLPACLLACLPACLLACLPACLPACLLACLPACYFGGWLLYSPIYLMQFSKFLLVQACLSDDYHLSSIFPYLYLLIHVNHDFRKMFITLV